MDKKEEEFLKKLISIFKVEAKEHVGAITSGLIELEKANARTQTEHIETIYREAHSLKGAARSVNLKEIESICQVMESVFAALKRKDLTISPQLFDVLHQAVDCISKLISKDEEITALEKSQIKEQIRHLENVLKGGLSLQTAPQPSALEKDEPKMAEISQPPVHEKLFVKEEVLNKIETGQHYDEPSLTETVRISKAKLDSLLLQAEELLSVKLAAGQRAAELREINASFILWKKERAKLNTGVPEFFDPNHAATRSLESKLAALVKSADYDQRSLGGMVDNLLDDMKKVLMLPFSSLLEVFPKLVRDLSHDQGKEVELVIQGGEVEIDRRILEEMKDPLIHLVRNCIDHGIEKPEVRQQKKKPLCGTVRIAISSKDGGKIEILVSDDGAGCDPVEVKAAAIKRGIISHEESSKLNEQEALSLIFLSGVSTSQIITDVSGRGLGLAIVREKVEKLNGVVSFQTQPDAGTTFRIVVPLTLATFRGLLVHAGERMFVLPAANVERVIRVKNEEIKTVENRETISLNGQAVSLVRLRDVLELKRSAKSISDETVRAVVIGSAEKRMAFMVDEVLYEQEVLVKTLGKQLSRVRNIAGATVLGNGKAVPILNVHDLLKSAVKATAAPFQIPAEKVKEERRYILVVEDSITARALLKNIMESAGYDVKTAVDGIDALTALKTQEFDMVVSDVDMPRMNGFDLTSKIRSDKKLSGLPVVLVTGLESREDKERGVEVGANAYIVKSSFDQSNLLEVIQSLI